MHDHVLRGSLPTSPDVEPRAPITGRAAARPAGGARTRHRLRVFAVWALVSGAVATVNPQPSPTTAPVEAGPSILFVSPDDPDRPYIRDFADGLRQGLNSDGMRPTLYRESFDQGRFGDDPAYVSEFRGWLHRKYRGRPIHAIVVRQQATLELFARRPDNPWNDVPLVYSTMGPLSIDISESHPTASGVVMENPLPHLLDVIRRLLPETRRIAVIRGASPAELVREAWWLPQIRAHGLEVEDLVDLAMPELLRHLPALPPDTIPLAFSFQRDRGGQYFEPGEVVPLLAQASSRPVFTILGDNLSSGLLGGPRPDFTVIGRLTGRHVLARIAGAPPVTEVIPISTFVPSVFDARQLARWDIDEDLLPPGSIVHSRPPDLWRDHRGTVVAALTLGVVQSVLVAVVLVERRQRARAQTQLRASYGQLQDLTERLLTARDEERARIARDLHDDLAQRMASMSIGLSRVRRAASELSPPLAEAVTALQDQARTLAGDLRDLSHDLHPGALEHVGLLETLRERCVGFSADSGIPARLEAAGDVSLVPLPVALCLYRVAQEALQNVHTHAAARQVIVTLQATPGRVHLEVADDGRGFTVQKAGRRHGLGLVSLSERVRLLGGNLEVVSTPGEGTTLRASVPNPAHPKTPQ